MYTRCDTKKIQVGSVCIGGGAPIAVQSMTNTDTRDIRATVSQIHRLEDAGCDIVRVAVPDSEAAEAIAAIKSRIHIPLVADIHFDYRLALTCINGGVDKIRINPGNIGSRDKTAAVVKAAKERHIPIRIGVNGGSLDRSVANECGLQDKNGKAIPKASAKALALVESAMKHVRILEELDFTDIAISLKASDVPVTVEAYRQMAELRNYPLHVGVTEAGTPFMGTVKSCAGIGAVLMSGIGDTIRVSLTGDPVEEIKVGRELLHALDLGGGKLVKFVSCPSCGRCRIDLVGIATEVEHRLSDMERDGTIHKPIHVAVMGCAVNGPGEASDADIGIAGGSGEALLFERGEIKCKLKSDDIAGEFIDHVREYIKRSAELTS